MNSELFKTSAYVGGAWISAGNKETFEVRNPATGELVANVPNCRSAESKKAFEAAKEAFPAWSALTSNERSAKLRKLYELMLKHERELGEILTLEQGKPLPEAVREIRYGAAFLEWYAEEAKRVYGETIPSSSPEKRILVIKQPVGVCAAITPWNFPNAMITRKIAPALAAGCTMVVKPAPETPLSALAIAALAEKAEIPAGVFNVVTGDAIEFTKTAMSLDYVRKVTFTGSTEVGKILMRQAADQVKRLTFELGGNAPFIVFEDADLDKAVSGAIFAKYRNSGQTCICVNRFILHEKIAAEFGKKLAEKTRQLKVGDGMKEGSEIGPLINAEAVAKICDLISDATSHGAKVLAGRIPERNSLWVEPTVLSDIKTDMRIWKEEIFGPISALSTFRDEEEALTKANDSVHGLASYVYTKDFSRAFRVAESLQFGMVGVNDTVLSYVQAPFGGIKQSGFGREGGKYGIEDYLNIKYINLGL